MEQVLVNWIWSILCVVAGFLLVKYLDHEKRIQKMEDTTTNEVKELKEDFKEFKKEVSAKLDMAMNQIKDMGIQIHKEKNVEQQMQSTLANLLKFMEENKKYEN